ncbi:MAG TPA: hypothetical protein VFR90_08530 [Methylibium sp.]|uniref:hypothetical protein n=1 Tax=Methylibium sp. TaxID=2067992 RepID=UPI002DBDF630|nr:hypothetical protein [Methylibium sp.]HEU4459152.1 hypothetical protein [Methylibium sp.]
MNQAVRKSLAAIGLVGASLASMAAAHAGGVNWHIGINLPAPPIYYEPPPRVVYAPPPVVYGPAPIIYAPAPVYAPRGHWRDGRWRDHDRRHRHHHHHHYHRGHGYGDDDDRRDGRRYRY